MKKLLPFFALSILTCQTAFSQPENAAPPFLPRTIRTIPNSTPQEQPPALQKFNLDFPGGKPGDLVAAIEKASGKPLNAIIPKQFEDVQIPPMKLSKVTVPALFEAMKNASRKEVRIPGGSFPGGGWQVYQTYYAFETRGQGEDAVWYFSAEQPPESPEPEKYCRFYQLDDYLTNYKIEDIITAIKTGWAMLGVNPAPELKFHPETKLLIAVGPSSQLGVIENVLAQLRKAASQLPAPPAPLPPRLLPQKHKTDGTSSEP